MGVMQEKVNVRCIKKGTVFLQTQLLPLIIYTAIVAVNEAHGMSNDSRNLESFMQEKFKLKVTSTKRKLNTSRFPAMTLHSGYR